MRAFFYLGGCFRLPFPLFCCAALHKKSSTQAGPLQNFINKFAKSKTISIFAQLKLKFQRNLFRKVEGIDPMKPWQPAPTVRCQLQPSNGKNKSKVSL